MSEEDKAVHNRLQTPKPNPEGWLAVTCPQCGGDGGYEYLMAMQFVQKCSWSGIPIAFEHRRGPRNYESKVVECVDCLTRFRRSTIDKLQQQGGDQ